MRSPFAEFISRELLSYSIRTTRFDAEAATWATPTHEAFMVHAAAAAAARAIGNAVRAYAKARIMRQYMIRALTERAPLVPRPNLSG